MSYYLGPLYFEEKDFFLLLALGAVVGGWFLGLYLPLINYPVFMVLLLLFLTAKTFFVKTAESLVYLVFLLAFMLSTLTGLNTVILFVLFSFLFLRIVKLL